MNEFNKYFSKCGLIGELPEKISTLSNIKKTSFKTFNWNDFWCKASWFVVGIILGLVVAMIL